VKTKTAVLAGGCFWGMEELMRRRPGVVDTEVGYVGGDNERPTYRHHPGHAEAVRVEYDPSKASYRDLLDFFFQVHDPTTRNRQGNDVGSSYRSAIFYANDEEKREAEEMIELVNASGRWSDPVVTVLEPLGTFYPAEPYHQDYLQANQNGYTCHFVRAGGTYLRPNNA
jgi:peptide-methionine (S)-S-oxide reductase